MPSMHGEQSSSLRSSVRLRFTSVTEQSGYIETILGSGLRLGERGYLGALVPLVRTRVEEDVTSGLGNIVLVGSWSVPEVAWDVELDVGLQIEFPTVTEPQLGDGHYLALSTLQLGWHPDEFILMSVLGMGQVLEGEHHHDTVGSIVNPHANSEILHRLDVGRGWRLGSSRIRTTFRVDSVQELSGHHGSGDLIVTVGPHVGWMHEALTFDAHVLVPVTNARRYAIRSGIRCSIQFS